MSPTPWNPDMGGKALIAPKKERVRVAAFYRLEARIISRSEGRKAVACAAYRSGSEMRDERYGLVHDYTRKRGIMHSEIVAPADTPAWMLDRSQLWNGVEAAEKRKDSQLAREILLSLPHQFSESERIEIVRQFVQDQYVSQGMIADMSLHEPDLRGDNRNYHAHVMLTMRSLTEDGFGPKERAWNDDELLKHWRQEWENHLNRELERIGSDERVDCRSLADRGIDREPEPKQGQLATEMERNGKRSHAGDDRRAAKERNKERSDLAHEEQQVSAEIIDMEAEREKRDGPDPLLAMRRQHIRERQELDAEQERRREALAQERREANEAQRKRLDDELRQRVMEEEQARQRRAENARPGQDANVIDRLTYAFNQSVEKFRDYLDPQRVAERERREREEEARRQHIRDERARREHEALEVRQAEQEREMLESNRQRENDEKRNLLQAQERLYLLEKERQREREERDRAPDRGDKQQNKDDRDDRDDRG